MKCPQCHSTETTKRPGTTSVGYVRFACRTCRRRFNERTGTPFNELQYPTDIVLNAVLWRLRYKLSLRDVAELLLVRGYTVTHETVREWEARFAPLLADRLREKRRDRRSVSWYLDETYVKVAGHWRYLYRAIDRDGNLLDSMLSEHRDRQAARRFLRQVLDINGRRPLRVTTDRHPAYHKAIRRVVGRKVEHRCIQYLNNRTEQDHRGIKQRYYPMLGFGTFTSASRFCAAFDALRQYLRPRRRCGEHVPLVIQREHFAERWQALITEMAAA
jgi:transposase-like protein